MIDAISEISSKNGNTAITYYLTETELIRMWKHGRESGESSIHLSKLKPRVEHASSRPRGTKTKLVAGVILIAMAVIIYFSALQPLVPLLSWAIGFGGLIFVIVAARAWQIQDYSGFPMKAHDEWFCCIVHGECNAHQLEQFEASFEEQCAVAQFQLE